MTDLDVLLSQAREADPTDRINLRDAIAAHGEAAIDAMSDWLGDGRLAAFAIRVLERIGSQADERSAAVAVLAAVDRTDLPPHLLGDLERALAALGVSPIDNRAPRSQSGGRPSRLPGWPGVPGRGYWVMRTSPWERPYLWAEASEGRLRQGWGVADEQNLEVTAEAIRQGRELTPLQRESRRALRMLASWPSGMGYGDVVVAPNLPEYGRLSVFRVTNSYEWSLGPKLTWGERFGHVLPVELLVANVDRRDPVISDGLRAILRVQTRLYNISGYGGDVERVVGREMTTDRRGESWLESEYEALFGRFPALGSTPTTADVDELSIELGRTPDAVSWQWNDGAAYVQGRPASTTSAVLKTWLDDRSAAASDSEG